VWCMKRTNIYLGEDQSAALDAVARAQGRSRAEVIRELIDRELSGSGSADLDTDLIAINGSFGVLSDDGDAFLERGPDERAAHLNRVAGR
jgi:Ribbon-helix-helix protein, copG family